MDPESPERHVAETIENSFRGDFQVMSSKNNIDRPKAEREYFDRPIEYTKQGFEFTPHHRRPIHLLGQQRGLHQLSISSRAKSFSEAWKTGSNFNKSFGEHIYTIEP